MPPPCVGQVSQIPAGLHLAQGLTRIGQRRRQSIGALSIGHVLWLRVRLGPLQLRVMRRRLLLVRVLRLLPRRILRRRALPLPLRRRRRGVVVRMPLRRRRLHVLRLMCLLLLQMVFIVPLLLRVFARCGSCRVSPCLPAAAASAVLGIVHRVQLV